MEPISLLKVTWDQTGTSLVYLNADSGLGCLTITIGTYALRIVHSASEGD